MRLVIPEQVAEKASAIPETSYGACVVTLVLADRRRIENVTLAWGKEIVKVGGRPVLADSDIDFDATSIIDVLPENSRAQ